MAYTAKARVGPAPTLTFCGVLLGRLFRLGVLAQALRNKNRLMMIQVSQTGAVRG